jgi:hypothetical protein
MVPPDFLANNFIVSAIYRGIFTSRSALIPPEAEASELKKSSRARSEKSLYRNDFSDI